MAASKLRAISGADVRPQNAQISVECEILFSERDVDPA